VTLAAFNACTEDAAVAVMLGCCASRRFVRARLHNDEATERAVAARELGRITVLRAERALAR
jgi:hypothetical protein